ncbi:hypothetical protein C1Y35_26470 [Pseudomonas sp. GW456-L14]|nr:hypothetical protein C1Y35_26470 [Pseudomonas sp. GW456-L14]PMY50111.1 hypothetical protein C1Y34_26595 [Pseudomonas sp. GW456-L12]
MHDLGLAKNVGMEIQIVLKNAGQQQLATDACFYTEWAESDLNKAAGAHRGKGPPSWARFSPAPLRSPQRRAGVTFFC